MTSKCSSLTKGSNEYILNNIVISDGRINCCKIYSFIPIYLILDDRFSMLTYLKTNKTIQTISHKDNNNILKIVALGLL